MATQSLYRRYRPRRFSEIRGQEHVVRALRNAVINNREAQGYLFSGPRGTGKTTSARVLAKVLNCANPIDGEPCCECESCLAVQAGASFDVHELDAASNNGVDAMRDLIEKASLGTPGRHKVYILDEVHMLSKGAEAALLKTLEEPPPHVVFVLATTDPQKVSATIRSRVQHLEFHLLPMDELEQHVRWVVDDAGLTVSEEAIQAVLEQGGGSARDTLSALELVAASGGEAPDVVSYDEFVEAMINRDPGQAVAALAHAVQQGRDPRALSVDLVRHLRDCFLSLMAPELVQLSEAQLERVGDQARRLGAPAIVRAMEQLGTMLVEMRHAPDARLLLDIALVQLTHDHVAADVDALNARLDRIERSLGATPSSGGGVGTGSHTGSIPRPTPIDPATGRAALGGRARSEARAAPAPAPAAAAEAALAAPAEATAPVEPTAPVTPEPAAVTPAPAAAPEPTPAPAASTSSTQASGGDVRDRVTAAWQGEILPTLKPMTRALYSAGRFVLAADGGLAFGLPNDTHRSRCEQYRADVEAAISRHVGQPVTLTLVTDSGQHADDPLAPVVPLRSSATGTSRASALPADDEVDLDDLIDAPPESVRSPIDRLADAFPGSVVVDEQR